jgi:UDP-N-acetylmuramoyl-L-alanyl-D-glutamate--2,6-diaminopimelate ligase
MTTSAAVAELADAAADLVLRRPEAGVNVSGLAYDSRTTSPGDMFFCVPGTRQDGHAFAPRAVTAGAAALCVQRPLHLGVPELVVSDARRALALISAAFYRYPASEMKLLGVTGTNGKTTSAFLLESILSAAGHRTGLIGTIETRVAGKRRKGVRTTPESLDLQRLFYEMRREGVDAVAMEVTSHALCMARVDGVRFAAAIFTNLSQDHLDFHAGMEDYFAAKSSLFTPERAGAGAVNLDDPFGRRLAEEAAVPVMGFGLAADAEVRAVRVRPGPAGTDLTVLTPAGRLEFRSSLVGDFNVSNCLAACAGALLAGVEPEQIERGLGATVAVPGRFEAIDRGQPFAVVVDYAHTPDSLDNVLREARRMARRQGGRVLCVFGCGGDRDRGKRPLMGAVAARLADVVVVTSDNPRSEDPESIIAQILEGVAAERAGGADIVDPDRREAIHTALAAAQEGDVVLIAGKGHETGQEFAGEIVPFDDRTVAAAALQAAGWRSAS